MASDSVEHAPLRRCHWGRAFLLLPFVGVLVGAGLQPHRADPVRHPVLLLVPAALDPGLLSVICLLVYRTES